MEISSDHKNENENCSATTPVIDEENQDQRLLLSELQKVNIIKVVQSSLDDDQEPMMNGDDDGDGDGYKTPTKKEHRLTVDLTCPPPAPMKPKSRIMKRRRPTRRPLFQVSPQDFELIFAPHRSSVLPHGDDIINNNINNNNNNNYYNITVDSSGNNTRIKKVNQPNLPTLMSFR